MNLILKPSLEIPKELRELKLNPITLQLLVQRGFFSMQEATGFLNGKYEDIHDPTLLKGVPEAVSRILAAAKKKEKVVIYGDYDADGITATTVLGEALKEIGIQAATYIPDRNKEGYGINTKALDFIKKEYAASLLITVDCGTSNADEIDYAKKIGLEAIVTDHHAIPKKLPAGTIIVHPKLPKQKYPFQDLAGVGVAFKLAQALWEKKCPQKIGQLKWLLDLVAIGTIADCVPLVDENRIFAKFGLIVLQKTKRVGLQELLKTARIDISDKKPPTAESVAFYIGPRFNAAGRMDHADLTLNLLTESDRAKARLAALEVEAKNSQRQKITQQIFTEIKDSLDPNQDYRLIIKSGKNWPLGIVGIVAGKIAEEFNCPTFILREAEEILEGSGRSVDGFDLIQAVSKAESLVEKYGGHAQAMGIKVKPQNLKKFEKKLLEVIEKDYNKVAGGRKISADVEIPIETIDWDLLSEIKRFEPFGKKNEEPVFVTRGFQVENVSLVGNGQKHLKFLLIDPKSSGRRFEAIYFKGAAKTEDLRRGDNVSVVYNLRSNEWNGSHKIDLNILEIFKN